MFPRNNNVFTLVKWLIMSAAYGFLIYKLAHIEYWNELQAKFAEPDFYRTLILIFVLLLMPINWMLETVKWQLLCKNTIKLSFSQALKSVLAGLNTGYISPNRIGDFVGRILFFPSGKRVPGVFLSFLNSISQNIVLTVLGIVAAFIYFSQHPFLPSINSYFAAVGAGLLLVVVLYFAFPGVFSKLKKENWSEKFKSAIQGFSSFSSGELVSILGVSLVRYLVFCFQFYLMLCFFGIEISWLEAAITIPTMYLLITFTPSFAAAEPAIRGSIAVLIFSVYSQNEVEIILTGILIWIINFVIPMIVGSVVVGKAKSL